MADGRGNFDGEGFRWWRNLSPVTLPPSTWHLNHITPDGRRQIHRNPRFQPAGRRPLPPLEFVDEVCIVNTDDLRFQRRQMTDRRQAQTETPNAGLSEQFIAKNLKTKAIANSDLKFCVICQEEERERIGILKCGHEYHCSCITVWLQHNNICPLCKARAL